VFVRSPDPMFGEKYTFGIACQTVCGYGERANLTIYYPGKFLVSSNGRDYAPNIGRMGGPRGKIFGSRSWHMILYD